MEAFSEEAARPFVLDLVKRQSHYFASYPQIDRHDLAQEVMIAARAAWATCPDGLALSTCVYRAGRWRLNTIRRGLRRQKNRDNVVAATMPMRTAPTMEVDGEKVGCVDEQSLRHEYDAEDLTEWLANIHRTIRRNFTTYNIPLVLTGRRGRRHTFDRAQAAALLSLMKKRSLTCRGMVMLLKSRPALCDVVGLPRCPSYGYFHLIKESVKQINFASN